MNNLYLVPKMLNDQREVLANQPNFTEEEAEELWEDVRLKVNLTSQEADKDWDDHTIDTVTNTILAFQVQMATRQRQQRSRRRRLILANLVLHAVLIGLGYTAITGYTADGATTSVLMTIGSTVVLFLWLAVGQHVIRVRR